MAERDFKGVWIPREVWLDTSLTANEKFYLAIYLQNERNETETDKMMLSMVSKPTICSIKKELRKLGLIDTITSSEQAKEQVLFRKGQGGECEWCGIKTFALQEHHYPVPRSKGGTKTVTICPNCHSEYHAIIKNGG